MKKGTKEEVFRARVPKGFKEWLKIKGKNMSKIILKEWIDKFYEEKNNKNGKRI